MCGRKRRRLDDYVITTGEKQKCMMHKQVDDKGDLKGQGENKGDLCVRGA